MRRSWSNNNLSSPSYWSFVDKTVVVVAGTEPHQSADDDEEYRSPSKIFSTLKKRTRFASQELEIIDKDHTLHAGPVTPKYSDFLPKAHLEQSSQKETAAQHNSNMSMFSSTLVATTKLVNITTLEAGETTPLCYRMYRQFENASAKMRVSEKEITKILSKESLIDFYLKRRELKILTEKVSFCQRLIRLKKFRKALKNLKIEETKRAIEKIELESRILKEKVEKRKREEEIYQKKLLEYVIRFQRVIRMKRFRIYLQKYKVKT
jgi:hypothetical protein